MEYLVAIGLAWTAYKLVSVLRPGIAADARALVRRGRARLGMATLASLERDIIDSIVLQSHVGLSRSHVPNRITVLLSPDDFGRIRDIRGEICEELTEGLIARIEKSENLVLLSPPSISLRPSTTVEEGAFEIIARISDEPPPPRRDATKVVTAYIKQRALVLRVEQPSGLKAKTYRLLGKMMVGRSEVADIKLQYPQISRDQAVIERRGAEVRLIDLDSANGTQVNGKEVPEEGVELCAGDRIRFGDLISAWVLDALPVPTAPTDSTLRSEPEAA